MPRPALSGHRKLYARFLLRSHADDGRFLAGVTSTGIYCLPSCPAKRPKPENVAFYRHPDDARGAGLRPCHRCRPDAFYRGEEFHETLFEETSDRIVREPARFRGIPDIARASGLSRTALNELFLEHAQESPASFLRRIRIQHAMGALERCTTPLEAAASAGFGSASAFHTQFVERTGLTPAAFAALKDKAEFVIRLPKGYRRREVLDFFGRDQAAVSERVGENSIEKSFEADGAAALIAIRFTGNNALCATDPGHAFAAHRAVLRILGFESDSSAFERRFARSAADPVCRTIARNSGLRIPLTPSAWEALAWAIMGQQISLKAAVTLRRNLIQAIGKPHSSGLIAFPAADAVAALDPPGLRALGFSGSKGEYLLAAATAVSTGELPIETLRRLSIRHAARKLAAIRGIGPWTVQYVFLRGLGLPDCLPAGDAGLAQGLEKITGERPDEKGVCAALDPFAPYRSLASCHVWATLND